MLKKTHHRSLFLSIFLRIIKKHQVFSFEKSTRFFEKRPFLSKLSLSSIGVQRRVNFLRNIHLKKGIGKFNREKKFICLKFIYFIFLFFYLIKQTAWAYYPLKQSYRKIYKLQNN